MCAVSMIGDGWARRDKWPDWPQTVPFPTRDTPTYIPVPGPKGKDGTDGAMPDMSKYVTSEDFEALRNLVVEMKKELEDARAQDLAEGNPDCEMEEKVATIKQIAAMFGVELKDVFPND